MREQFITSLENHFYQNLEGISPLQKAIREKAWDRFMQLGLPEKKTPGYQYFPLSQFYHESFSLPSFPEIPKEVFRDRILPECRQSIIVFVNGQFSKELSNISGLPDEVVVLPLKDALAKYGNFLQVRLKRALSEEVDPFATLNIALIQLGLFFYLPPNVKIDAPVQCIHIHSHDRPVIFSPRIHFYLGKQAEMQWTTDSLCLKDFEYFSNSVIDVALEEGTNFSYYGITNPCKHGWHFEAMRATLKRDSQLKSLTCTAGAKGVRQDFRISLTGENASCDLKGLSMLAENKQAHVNILIDHKAPHCQSSQLFKNILTDTSRSSFEGKIFVHPEAQKTEAYQLNNNLILGKKAVANSKPNLEIFADDVKASHGATVTQLNPAHALYLKTRGIPTSIANRLLLSGFSLDVLRHVPHTPIRERMQEVGEKSLR